jgi:hypothetical protein
VTARGYFRRRDSSAGWRAPVTVGELRRRFGRGVLWALVVVLLVRGFAGVVTARPRARQLTVARVEPAAWPDAAARAFAADFARTYLTFSPEDSGAQLEAVTRFVSPELAGSIVAEVEHAERAVSVVVARSAAIDSSHALITVAVGGTSGSRYLTVAGRA